MLTIKKKTVVRPHSKLTFLRVSDICKSTNTADKLEHESFIKTGNKFEEKGHETEFFLANQM